MRVGVVVRVKAMMSLQLCSRGVRVGRGRSGLGDTRGGKSLLMKLLLMLLLLLLGLHLSLIHI